MNKDNEKDARLSREVKRMIETSENKIRDFNRLTMDDIRRDENLSYEIDFHLSLLLDFEGLD